MRCTVFLPGSRTEGPFVSHTRRATPHLRICRRRWHRRRMTSTESASVSTGPASGQRSEPKVPDRVRKTVRLRHCSYRTEGACVTWDTAVHHVPHPQARWACLWHSASTKIAARKTTGHLAIRAARALWFTRMVQRRNINRDDSGSLQISRLDMDTLTSAARSAQMSRIRGTNTQPEFVIRRLVHHVGYRYRLHLAALPGRPDLVFPSRRKVIFVHGCFWHQHSGCSDATMPKSRVEFWANKLGRNVQRDHENRHALNVMGWEVLTVWECEITDPKLPRRLARFLDSTSKTRS